jgi:quinol monooxygenase YgiN
MIVMYVSMEFTADPAEFDAWIMPLFRKERQEPGVVAYDCLIDSENPQRRRVVEIFEDDAAAERHVTSPAHIEMLALGTMKYGMHDLVIQVWDRAEGYRHSTRARSDTPVAGRDVADRLIATFQQEYRERPRAGP